MSAPLTPKSILTVKNILIVLIAVLLIFLGWFIWSQRTHIDNEQKAQPTPQKYTIFEGTVTGINNGCAYDATCTVSVDNRAIITGGGLSSDPEANVYGVTDADLASGDKVSVKALNSDYGLTLQGCRECYITDKGK